jgi:hypothetical protein
VDAMIRWREISAGGVSPLVRHARQPRNLADAYAPSIVGAGHDRDTRVVKQRGPTDADPAWILRVQ